MLLSYYHARLDVFIPFLGLCLIGRLHSKCVRSVSECTTTYGVIIALYHGLREPTNLSFLTASGPDFRGTQFANFSLSYHLSFATSSLLFLGKRVVD
jgi:hypothetical protein